MHFGTGKSYDVLCRACWTARRDCRHDWRDSHDTCGGTAQLWCLWIDLMVACISESLPVLCGQYLALFNFGYYFWLLSMVSLLLCAAFLLDFLRWINTNKNFWTQTGNQIVNLLLRQKVAQNVDILHLDTQKHRTLYKKPWELSCTAYLMSTNQSPNIVFRKYFLNIVVQLSACCANCTSVAIIARRRHKAGLYSSTTHLIAILFILFYRI